MKIKGKNNKCTVIDWKLKLHDKYSNNMLKMMRYWILKNYASVRDYLTPKNKFAKGIEFECLDSAKQCGII